MGRWILSAVILLIPVSGYAFTVPPNDGFVTDTVGVLQSSEESALERTLSQYRTETSNEIAILIIDSLQGEVIADLAVEIGREWGIGDEQKNNGIMMLMSYSDREIFLATGYGLEGAVPDIVAKGIIDQEILPQFREGNYYQGFANALVALEKHIGGEYTADRYKKKPSISGDGIEILFFFAIIALELLAAFLGRSKSWWFGGVLGFVAGIFLVIFFRWWISIPILTILGLVFDYIVSKTYKKGRGSSIFWGGGRGGGGGGFGGFGGGSFGGGGAGGRW